MPRESKIVKCVDCQELFPRKLLSRMGRCPDCAFKAMWEVAFQLHEHKGHYYEKWKAACEAKASSYIAGIKGEKRKEEGGCK